MFRPFIPSLLIYKQCFSSLSFLLVLQVPTATLTQFTTRGLKTYRGGLRCLPVEDLIQASVNEVSVNVSGLLAVSMNGQLKCLLFEVQQVSRGVAHQQIYLQIGACLEVDCVGMCTHTHKQTQRERACSIPCSDPLEIKFSSTE